MHEEFKKVFKDKDLSFSTVEEGIKCPKNYLSRFINGPKDLPTKWEKKIREFLKGVAIASNAGIKPKDADKFFQKGWVPAIEKYCLEEAGIDPEKLIEEHRGLLAANKKKPVLAATPETKVNETSKPLPETRTTSNWWNEMRNKKLGIK